MNHRLKLYTKEGPYLHINTSDQVIIIAFKDPARTKQLYGQIVSQRDGG